MSYEVHPLRGTRRPASYRVVRRHIPVPRMYERPEYTGLGFSLKPPRFIRKLQPGKILKKIAVPLAIGAAIVAIPGVAPAIGRGIAAAGRVVGIGKAKSLLPVGALKQASKYGGPLLGRRGPARTPGFGPDILNRGGTAASAPAPSMPILTTDLEATSPATTATQPAFTPGPGDFGVGLPAGGGAAAGPFADTPNTLSTAAGPSPLLIGALVIGGLMLASSGGGGGRRRRRAA